MNFKIFLFLIGLIANSSCSWISDLTEINNYENKTEAVHRIIVPLNLTSFQNKTDLKSNIRLSVISHKNDYDLPFNIIQEDDMFYLITSVDHPSKFALELNVFSNKKLILNNKYNYTINKISGRFDSSNIKQVGMVFKNLKFSDYLVKESKLIDYFDNTLGNSKTLVINVEKIENDDLKVVLGMDVKSLSKATRVFMFDDTCPKLNNTKLTKEIGLPLKNCSVYEVQTPLVLSNYSTNKLSIDLAVTSGSNKFFLDYILFVAMMLFGSLILFKFFQRN